MTTTTAPAAPARIPDDASPIDHVYALGKHLFAVLTVCADVGVKPVHIEGDAWGEVHVQISGEDTGAADTLADVLGLDPDDGDTGNYTRTSTTTVHGHTLGVTVYCGRPTGGAS